MATIKDVARKANVSVTTVSRVLNNNGYVHQDTKKIIEDAMNELKYAPNLFAEVLSKGTSNIIGIIIENITNPNLNRLIDSIEKECTKNGFKLILGITRNSIGMEEYYLSMFKKYNVDGIIIGSKISHYQDFIDLNKPIISIDHNINDNISSINIDYNLGSILAAKEFLKCECKNVLILKYTDVFNKPLEKLISELNEYGINTTTKSLDGEFNKNELLEYLDTHVFDGIYTTCDIIAISTISILHKLRIKVPEKCCVIGCSSSSFASIITPTLTSIDFPTEKLAIKSFNTLLDYIINKNENVIHEVIDVSLIKRESTK
ncbi:MAG: LacI family DNA-binding transcriptional regulator [bacterium]